MLIREYKPEDKEAVKQCIFELQEDEYKRNNEYWAEPSEVPERYLEYLLKFVGETGGKIYVAEMDNNVAGYIAVAFDEGKDSSPCIKIKKYAYIPDFVVLRQYQKSGIGKELLATAEKFAKEKLFDYMFLDVTYGNPALDFYYKYGYTNRSTALKKKLE